MTKKEKSELQQLNSKFDILIQLMTQQQGGTQQAVKQSPVQQTLEEPLKRGRGRPRKQEELVVQAPVQTPEPKFVKLFVSPCININGVEYGGNVEVPEGIASQLRNMMQRWEAYERKTQQFKDHGTRDHGVIQ